MFIIILLAIWAEFAAIHLRVPQIRMSTILFHVSLYTERLACRHWMFWKYILVRFYGCRLSDLLKRRKDSRRFLKKSKLCLMLPSLYYNWIKIMLLGFFLRKTLSWKLGIFYFFRKQLDVSFHPVVFIHNGRKRMEIILNTVQ